MPEAMTPGRPSRSNTCDSIGLRCVLLPCRFLPHGALDDMLHGRLAGREGARVETAISTVRGGSVSRQNECFGAATSRWAWRAEVRVGMVRGGRRAGELMRTTWWMAGLASTTGLVRPTKVLSDSGR